MDYSKTLEEWQDYYNQPENFGRLFSDHVSLKLKPSLNGGQRIKLKATTSVIDQKMRF